MFIRFLTNNLPCVEIKEHDVSPEAGDIVTDEPHHQNQPSADDTPETPEATESPHDPGSRQHEQQQDLNFGAVSGFLSGFAAAVQATVSSGLPVLLP